MLKWTKSGLKSGDYVYFYKDKRFYENYLPESFRGRVQLKNSDLQDGEASVVLRNVTFNDTGTYQCIVGTKGSRQAIINNITLNVGETGEFVVLSLCLSHDQRLIEKIDIVETAGMSDVIKVQ